MDGFHRFLHCQPLIIMSWNTTPGKCSAHCGNRYCLNTITARYIYVVLSYFLLTLQSKWTLTACSKLTQTKYSVHTILWVVVANVIMARGVTSWADVRQRRTTICFSFICGIRTEEPWFPGWWVDLHYLARKITSHFPSQPALLSPQAIRPFPLQDTLKWFYWTQHWVTYIIPALLVFVEIRACKWFFGCCNLCSLVTVHGQIFFFFKKEQVKTRLT